MLCRCCKAPLTDADWSEGYALLFFGERGMRIWMCQECVSDLVTTFIDDMDSSHACTHNTVKAAQ